MIEWQRIDYENMLDNETGSNRLFRFFFLFSMSSNSQTIPTSRPNQQTPSGPGDAMSSSEPGGRRATQ